MYTHRRPYSATNYNEIKSRRIDLPSTECGGDGLKSGTEGPEASASLVGNAGGRMAFAPNTWRVDRIKRWKSINAALETFGLFLLLTCFLLEDAVRKGVGYYAGKSMSYTNGTCAALSQQPRTTARQ